MCVCIFVNGYNFHRISCGNVESSPHAASRIQIRASVFRENSLEITRAFVKNEAYYTFRRICIVKRWS